MGNMKSRTTLYSPDYKDYNVDKLPPVEGVLLIREEVTCKIMEFYDGDTVKILFYFGDILIKTNIRLKGIDAPEKKSKNLLEKEKACWITSELNKLYRNRMGLVTFVKHDKYGGRVIANIKIDGVDLSSKIMDQGWAKPYEGKKKEQWTKKELIQIGC